MFIDQKCTLLLIGVVLLISTMFGIGTEAVNDSNYTPRSKRSKVISKMKNSYSSIQNSTSKFQKQMKSTWIYKIIMSMWIIKILTPWYTEVKQTTTSCIEKHNKAFFNTLTSWYVRLHNKARLTWASRKRNRQFKKEVRQTSCNYKSQHRHNHINRILAMYVVAMSASGTRAYEYSA